MCETMKTTVRIMIGRDVPELIALGYDLDAKTLQKQLHRRNMLNYVAEIDGRVAGHMAYILGRRCFVLERFFVAPGARRRGVGTMMWRKLHGKLGRDPYNRDIVVCMVPDTALDVQLFLKASGFRATGVVDDYYRMVFRVPIDTEAGSSEPQMQRW